MAFAPLGYNSFKADAILRSSSRNGRAASATPGSSWARTAMSFTPRAQFARRPWGRR